MAQPKFIPYIIGEETVSNAERKIFADLHSLEFSNSYVFHSVGLPFHNTKIYGETDYILLCPKGFIILEVKGGRVKCFEGRWSYMNRRGQVAKKNESPFNQAKDNMFAVRDYLHDKLKNKPELFNKILFGYGVMFPDIQFDSRGIEDPDVLFLDSRKLVRPFINDLCDYWFTRPNTYAELLSNDEIDEIAKLIRNDFAYEPNTASALDRTEHNLQSLTEAQLQVFEGVLANKRLIIRGAAGTGKSVLASYYAARCAEEGKKVLYLTYNKNLANISRLSNKHENIKTINVHAYYGEYIKIETADVQENSNKFFTKILPGKFDKKMEIMDDRQRDDLSYDVLVMDEAQDFITYENIHALKWILRGGFAKGQWAAFYDETQNIYNNDFEKGFELLENFEHTKFALKINCRNTSEVAAFASQKTGIQNEAYVKEHGGEVHELKYNSDEVLTTLVNNIIKAMNKGGIKTKEIVFISPHSYKNSVFCRAGIPMAEMTENLENPEGLPVYSSIPAFKGLDSKVVVVADLETAPEEKANNYFYIAATRARELLFVLSFGEREKKE